MNKIKLSNKSSFKITLFNGRELIVNLVSNFNSNADIESIKKMSQLEISCTIFKSLFDSIDGNYNYNSTFYDAPIKSVELIDYRGDKKPIIY